MVISLLGSIIMHWVSWCLQSVCFDTPQVLTGRGWVMGWVGERERIIKFSSKSEKRQITK